MVVAYPKKGVFEMAMSKQIATGLTVGICLTVFLIVSINAISSFDHATPIYKISPLLRSSDYNVTLVNNAATEYCRTNYTPDGYFHHVHRVLHLFDRSIVFLDVGGNEGVISLPALVCTPARHRVITVEPVTENIDILTSLASAMGVSTPSYHWHLIRGGLSNITEQATIYVPVGRGDNAALSETASTMNIGGSAKPERIQLYNGDDVIFNEGWKPNVIKIDVQGTELFVLNGLKSVLSEERNMVLVMEYDIGLMSAHRVTGVQPFDLLTSLGFRAFCKPELILDREIGAVYANVSASLELTRDVMSTTGPDRSACGDITYVKYTGNGADGK